MLPSHQKGHQAQSLKPSPRHPPAMVSAPGCPPPARGAALGSSTPTGAPEVMSPFSGASRWMSVLGILSEPKQIWGQLRGILRTVVLQLGNPVHRLSGLCVALRPALGGWKSWKRLGPRSQRRIRNSCLTAAPVSASNNYCLNANTSPWVSLCI